MPQNPKPQASKQATTSIPKRDASKSFASMVAGKWKNSSGGGDEGKNKTALVQNSNPRDFSFNNRDTCKESILRQREQLRAKILSTINGIESNGIKSELTLDLYMRMERGKDGRWAIVWSKVSEVGPKVVQPIKPTVHNIITSSPFNTAKPRSVWRPRQSQTLVNPAHS